MLAVMTLMGLSSLATGGEEVDDLREVKPILAKRCYACHGELRRPAGLRFDTAALIRRGVREGPGSS